MSSGRTRLGRTRCYRSIALWASDGAVLTAQNPRKVHRNHYCRFADGLRFRCNFIRMAVVVSYAVRVSF